MRKLITGLLIISIVAISGCTDKVDRGTSERHIQSETIEITSGNLKYPAYIATPLMMGKSLQ